MKFYYRIVNVALLILMFIVIYVFSVWKATPKSLNVSGNAWIRGYIETGESSARTALEGLKNDDAHYAEKLLNDWGDIGHEDRYYAHKRKIMLGLSEHLIATSQYKKSADLLLPFVQENDRDIVMFIEWVKSALKVPEIEKIAGAELALMAKRFPDHAILNTLYIRGVLFKNDEAGALAALTKSTKLTPKMSGWSVSWTVGTTAKYQDRVWIKLSRQGKSWLLDVLAPSDVSTFRIDPPPHVRMDISDIRIESGTTTLEYSVSEISEFNMLTVDKEALSADGFRNPYFVLPTPDGLSGFANEGHVNASIVFAISNVGFDAVPGEVGRD